MKIPQIGQTKASAQMGLEQVNRPFNLSKGVVTNNTDPENQRRIKATTAIMPGIDTQWLTRLKMIPGIDAPLPEIGSTVLILYEENNPLKGFYILIENDCSPHQAKSDAILDHWLKVPGIIKLIRGNNVIVVTFANNLITIDGNVKINGNVEIVGNVTITGNLTLTSSSVSINGNQVATVGAVDVAGHPLVTKGW